MGLLQTSIDRLGEPWALALAGLLIGLAFGFFAQRSRFCLRSAVIEFSRNLVGGKLTVWLFAFSTAVVATQAWPSRVPLTPARRARLPRAAACRARPSVVRSSAWA
jgi:hypothetical protein